MGFKDISMSLEKDFSHVAYLVQCACNIFFFLISESWLTGNAVILSWKIKKKEESQLGAIARVTFINS